MYLSTAFATILLLGTSAAKTIVIDVGKQGLTFSPESSTADVGDTLEFHFFNTFHTAVQGDFDTPCQEGSLSDTGFNSGPIKNGADGSGSVFQVQVKDTKPIWFYCGTPTHCQSGMVGAINAPSSGNTLEAYKSAAAGTSSSQLKPNVQGGVVVPVGTPPSGGESSSSSEAPSASASSASVSSVASSATSITTVKATSTSSAAIATVVTTSSAASSSSGVSSTKTSAAARITSASAASSNSTAKPTQSIVPASGGSSLMEFAGNTGWMGIVAGLGFLFAFA